MQVNALENCSKDLIASLTSCPQLVKALLATLNSDRFGLSVPICSLRQARVILGRNTFHHFVEVTGRSLSRTSEPQSDLSE